MIALAICLDDREARGGMADLAPSEENLLATAFFALMEKLRMLAMNCDVVGSSGVAALRRRL